MGAVLAVFGRAVIFFYSCKLFWIMCLWFVFVFWHDFCIPHFAVRAGIFGRLSRHWGPLVNRVRKGIEA